MKLSFPPVIYATGIAAAAPLPAFAHGGHLGDLAGHSHWAGLAAVLGAAVLGAAAAKLRKRQRARADAETDGSEPPQGEASEPAKG